MVANSVLVHNGYFREVARIGMGVVAAMTCVGAYAIFDTSRYRAVPRGYTSAIYSCGALAAVVLMIRGPFRLAHQAKSGGKIGAAGAARPQGAA